MDVTAHVFNCVVKRSAGVLPGTLGAGAGFIQIPAFRLSNAVKSIFKVSKEDLVKAEAKAKEKPDKPGRKTT